MKNNDGVVLSINFSKKKGTAKIPMASGNFIENFGLQDDAHAGAWHRQVSLLSMESIHRADFEKIHGLCEGKFAENITTEGIVLHTLPVGTILEIGDTVMEITQIGKECHEGCEVKKTVGKCIVPKEGIFAKVLRGGVVKKGDFINIRKADDSIF